MASNNPRSPRQKMINLMYLVFIAMLALNVPAEVLDGFDLVEDGLKQTIKSTESQNNLTTQKLTKYFGDNPDKAGEGFKEAQNLTQESDKLFNYIQDLKVKIAIEADGKNADVNKIERKDKLGPASVIMLGPTNKEGEKLRNAIDTYRSLAANLLPSEEQKRSIEERLNTEVPKVSRWNNRNWEETYFEEMPTSAAITLLTKIQSDIRATQGEVLTYLYNSIDASDYRVNLLEARVIPKAEYVMAGGAYEGKVVLSAVDTTQRPTFSIPGIKPDGTFSIGAGAPGVNKVFSGNLFVKGEDGQPKPIPFRSEYHVVPKISTIQVTDANVLYQGEDNKMSISVPGLSNDQIRPIATNGSIRKSNDGGWIATPTKAGTNMKISIYNTRNNSLINEQEFRVRLLPDPTPYFEYPDANGNIKRFKSGNRIAKTTILNVSELKAAIDDGLLDRQFTVLRFSVVIYDGMGNRIPETSNSGQFTDKQKALIRQLGRGKTFLISDVKARGRDGVERDIPSLEVRLN
ncbi:MAG: gliding motility protein GldM [Dysgonomonas sp.]|nr:gliding motility protein GldM [Dysgonomonas sp.]